MTKIYLGCDHAGFELKEKIKVYLSGLEYEVEDRGSFSFVADDDYPDFVRQVAEAVAADKGSFGVILGGSGQGEAICANRVKGVRAVVFYGPKLPTEKIDMEGRTSMDTFEMIKLARRHNDANILSIGERFTTEDEAKFAVELFVTTPFPGDERHLRRINKIDLI
ncbi:MAG: RpiB/LacA/LacB family sugar-phosphate isomerase [Patescibacteria group bacterium]